MGVAEIDFRQIEMCRINSITQTSRLAALLLLCAPLYGGGAAIVITSVLLWLCPSVRNITHERIDGCVSNLILDRYRQRMK